MKDEKRKMGAQSTTAEYVFDEISYETRTAEKLVPPRRV